MAIEMDAHPIEPPVRIEIERRLKEVEAQHAVRILYACESGSRGWGFASPDSDYDVRFIYAHALPWYLQVSPARDVIELPISALLDINGWELRKALGLLKKGNATLIEWLDSPVVYRADPTFLARIHALIQKTHRTERTFHHYLHMARSNYREYLHGDRVRLKKYLYVLRPLLAALWIEQRRGVAPMRFDDLVNALIGDNALRVAIDQLLAIKRASPESEYGSPIVRLNQFIDVELTRLEVATPPVDPHFDFTPLDRFLLDTITSPPP
jgi:hypothetical protein